MYVRPLGELLSNRSTDDFIYREHGSAEFYFFTIVVPFVCNLINERGTFITFNKFREAG